jgi:hypothetical protein
MKVGVETPAGKGSATSAQTGDLPGGLDEEPNSLKGGGHVAVISRQSDSTWCASCGQYSTRYTYLMD